MSSTTAKCRTCDAAILWCASPATGANLPLDAEPNAEKGNIRIRRDGFLADVLTGNDLVEARARGDELHLNHFVTCPQAKEHRRPKPKQGELALGPGKR